MVRVALLLAASALALSACGGGSGGDEEAAGPSPGTTQEASAPAGDAVSLSGETLDGGALSLDEYRGKPVLVNVWASW